MSLYLYVGLPFCQRPVQPEWAVSIRNLAMPLNCTYGFAPLRGLPIDEARNALAESALAEQAKYLFFIDDDTAPPQHAITNLISILDSDPEAMVAGGIYFTREKRPQPIVFKEEGGGPSWDWAYKDVFECSSLGTGCMMVKTEVFSKIEKPWFKTILENETGVITDDIYFCRKVKEAGYKIFADGGVIPIHWDVKTGSAYTMSQDDPPVKRYKEQQAAIVANSAKAKFQFEVA